jgi:hypothetical protein
MNKTTLTSSEQWFVKEITKKRMEHNKKEGVSITPFSGSSLEQSYILGFSGEVAFCKIFNIYPSIEYDSYNNYDCVLNDLTIEVKTNTRPDGWLGIKDTPFNVDYDTPAYYALMIGNLTSNEFEFKGFISASSILNPWHHSKGKYYPMYSAYQNELITDLPRVEGWLFEQYKKVLSQ